VPYFKFDNLTLKNYCLFLPYSYTTKLNVISDIKAGAGVFSDILHVRESCHGHCGIHGNEEADALAKVGSSSLLWGRSLVFRWHLRVSNGGKGVVT
jgi:hypothetical protein